MCFGQSCRIDRQENIGGAVGALVLDAFEKLVFLAFDPIDFYAGLLGEGGIERLIGLLVTCRIEVQDFFLGEC